MKQIDILYSQWGSLKDSMSQYDKDRLEKKFKLEFNYNTNHIEGNTLTYGQTELLLLFDRSSDGVKMRDLEEMKAHNVCLQMVREEAGAKERPLTESFIRALHKTMLREDYSVTKQGADGLPTTYTIHAGIYKTRPNSVKTITGELFQYASPEETPALMGDLVQWYNKEEQKGEMNVIELASLFHYRYIRIHPFEDGNGRIARLLVNYILAKHDYPMLVVKSKDKDNYLSALNKCDVAVGEIPTDGAHADLNQIQPFITYLTDCEIRALEKSIQAANGESIEDEDDFAKQMEILSRQTFHPVSNDDRNDTPENKMDVYNLFHREFADKLLSALTPAERFYSNKIVHYFMSDAVDRIDGNGFFALDSSIMLKKDELTSHESDVVKKARSIMFHVTYNNIKAGYQLNDVPIFIHESVIFEPNYYTFHGENYKYGMFPQPKAVMSIIDGWKQMILSTLTSAQEL